MKPNVIKNDDNDDKLTPKSLRISQDRVHESIFIGGRRGEGKTTVLLQVLGKIERNEWPDYRSLGLLDPTLLETKQNLILSIVQRIREYLTQEESSWNKRSKKSEQKLQEANEALRILAKGITVLDGVGKDVHDEDWSDASFILDEGMERAEAAYGFEQGFRDFVSCAAEAIDCKAFVLCIDDVDTKSEMGGPVLEALRKYLTCPQLRVIVSGDPELLQSLTRKLQIEGLGQKFVEFEKNISNSHPKHSRMDMLLEQLSGLEDQFLTKVMPPNRRLRLKTLGEITSTLNTKILLKKKSAEEEVDLNDELSKVINCHWGERDPSTLRRFRLSILSMPVRSINEFLDVWNIGKNPNPADVTIRIIEIARSQLSDAGLRIDSIQNIPSPEMKLRRIVEWMCQEPSRWAEFSNLVPDGVHEDHDRVVLALSSIISGGALDKMSGVVNFWLLFSLLKDQIEFGMFGDYVSRKDNLLKFLAHVRYTQDQPLVDFLGYWSSWSRSPVENSQSGILTNSTIMGISVTTDRVRNPNRALKRMYNLDYNNGSSWNTFKSSDKKEISSFLSNLPKDLAGFHEKIPDSIDVYGKSQNNLSGALYNPIEGLAKRLDVTAASILLLPYSKIASPQSFEYGNYSLLPLIAGILELLVGRDAKVVIKGWQVNNTYPVTRENTLDLDDDLEDQENERNNLELSNEEKFNEEFIKTLETWANSDCLSGVISSNALISVWKKLTSSVSKLFKNINAGTGDLSKRNIFLGRFMHRQIIIFLHALGTEMYLREVGKVGVGSLGSPTMADNNLFDLLDILSSSKIDNDIEGVSGVEFEKSPGGELFYHMLECPIWAYFLEPDVYKQLRDHSLTKVDYDVSPKIKYNSTATCDNRIVDFDSLYYLLNTVVILEDSKK